MTFSLECSKLVRNYALSCEDTDGQCKNSELQGGNYGTVMGRTFHEGNGQTGIQL